MHGERNVKACFPQIQKSFDMLRRRAKAERAVDLKIT